MPIQYGYNELHRLSEFTQQAAGGNAVAAKHFIFEYNGYNNLTSIQRDTTRGNRNVGTSSYGYDNVGRLTSLTHHHNSTTLAAYSWSYDALGRIEHVTNADGTATYTYDAAGQLTDTVSSNPAISSEHYTYDANGNRTDANNSTMLGHLNRLEEDAKYTYQYDNEGNRTQRTEKTTGAYDIYTWDYNNRLTAVEHHLASTTLVWSVSYTYDYENRLVSRTTSTGTGYFTYDGNQMVLRLDANGNVFDRYTWGPSTDQLLADEQYTYNPDNTLASDNLFWALGDDENNVKGLVSYNEVTDTAQIVDHRNYDSFGQQLSDTNSLIDTLIGWTGRYLDPLTGLQNNLNRWYDSFTHQWVSDDPKSFDAGDANLRRYAGNDSVNSTDPSGLEELLVPTEHLTKPESAESIVRGQFKAKQSTGLHYFASPGALPGVDVETHTVKMNVKIDVSQMEEIPNNVLKVMRKQADKMLHGSGLKDKARQAAWGTVFNSLVQSYINSSQSTAFRYQARDNDISQGMYYVLKEEAVAKTSMQLLSVSGQGSEGAKRAIQERVFQELKLAPGGKLPIIGSGPRTAVRLGGRMFVIAGLVQDGIEIYGSSDPLKTTATKVSGWAGAAVGAELLGELGAGLGAPGGPIGMGIGGTVGAVVGGVVGYFVGETGMRDMWETAEYRLNLRGKEQDMASLEERLRVIRGWKEIEYKLAEAMDTLRKIESGEMIPTQPPIDNRARLNQMFNNQKIYPVPRLDPNERYIMPAPLTPQQMEAQRKHSEEQQERVKKWLKSNNLLPTQKSE